LPQPRVGEQLTGSWQGSFLLSELTDASLVNFRYLSVSPPQSD